MAVQDRSLAEKNKHARILLVEDDAISRELYSRILAPTHHITPAANGQDALDLLESETFDIILLDIMMPGMNGLEVLRTIRQNPELADMPVILMSALTDNEMIIEGLRAGANDYIPKPSDVNVVRARVETQVKLKRLMDDQKRTIAQLSAAQETRDRLFRIASHDLKSPLTNIRMAEFILRDLVGQDPAGQQILDTLVTTIENMHNVIEDFLDMGAFQNGQITLKLQPTWIEEAVMEALMQYSLMAHKKEIQLEFGALPGTVMVDPARLKQVLGNLVSNAIKYSECGSSVRIWSECAGNFIRISVADQGPGIPTSERDMLFKEFGKLTARPTAGESSTGLGLWIVKQLVSLQKGQVGVDCPPDGGSVFWIELPAYSCT